MILLAQQQKKHKADRTYYTFTLLMLSVVLVFAFGLMIGKQNNMQQAETVQKTVTVPKESSTEEITEPDTQAGTQAQKETVPEFTQATSFWSAYPHIYLRVNHEKKLELDSIADFDLSGAVYGINDENIASVDESGMITGLTRGECVISVSCNEETLHIPVTVRELTVENGCTYVDGILIANKTYGLPETYDPGMLPETAEAFERLQADASALGLDIYEGSGYRTYQYQITAYKSMCDAYGEEYANMYSAKPGYSEHQTGYTIDCNTIDNTFAEMDEGKWLASNCHLYGFIIRYPEGKEDITGYNYESWHIRYVGVEAATEIYEQGLTLEEYLDVESVHVAETTEPETTESETAESETAPSETTPEESADMAVTEENADNSEFEDAPLNAPV